MASPSSRQDATAEREPLRIEELRYPLTLENLQGTPREIRLGERDRGRLLVVDREHRSLVDARVDDLPRWFGPGDVLVLNNSKRIPGVLPGRSAAGGQVEIRFVELEDDTSGLCAIFPLHDIEVGAEIQVAGEARVRVEELGVTHYALARVGFLEGSLRNLLRTYGRPISGFFYENHWTCDHLNPYYATEEGTVESPLAGLHFTPRLVSAIEERGATVCFITLHSVGSWLPFLEASVDDHEMWPEYYSVPKVTAAAVNRARALGRKIFACGSTSLRALETAADPDGELRAESGRTNLYIAPGYAFKAVDAYFTNFHQYQTSLIVLDAAFAGEDLVLEAYREASERGYSFFEFGDAVLFT